jgi:hypothetical protein
MSPPVETVHDVEAPAHRSVDVALQSFFNGRERYLDEWKALLAAADERFVLHRVFVPKDSLLGIIEVHWNT